VPEGLTERTRPRVDPTFKLVFVTVVSITVGLITLYGVLALVCTVPTVGQAGLMDLTSSFAKIGMGTIFGLIGGSATR
jgi:hypothetical protein